MASPYTSFMKVSECPVREIRDTEPCNITGLAFFPDGNLCLCDFNNKACKLYDRDLTFLNKWSFSGSPYGVATHGKNTVLVTEPFEKRLNFGFPSNPGSLMFLKSLRMRYTCWGVTVSKDEIYVVCGRSSSGETSQVLVLTLDGKLQRTIQNSMFVGPNDIAVSDRGNIYISDCEAEKVICLDWEGEVRYFVTDARLRWPLGLIVLEDETLYVCGGTSNNVYLITADGKHLEDIMHDPCRAQRTCSLSVRSTDGLYVMGSLNSDVLLVYRRNSSKEGSSADVVGAKADCQLRDQEYPMFKTTGRDSPPTYPDGDLATPRKPPEIRAELPDNWHCSACTYLNKPKSIICEVCEELKSLNALTVPSSWNEGDPKHSESSTSSPDRLPIRRSHPSDYEGGQWKCLTCTFLNSEGSNNCAICNARRPSRNGDMGNVSTGYEDPKHRGTVITRPDTSPPARTDKSNAERGQWECHRCTLLNSQGSNNCEACETPRRTLSKSMEGVPSRVEVNPLTGPSLTIPPKRNSVEDLHIGEPTDNPSVADSCKSDPAKERTTGPLPTDNTTDTKRKEPSSTLFDTLPRVSPNHFDANRGEWKCAVCTCPNKLDTDTCAICETICLHRQTSLIDLSSRHDENPLTSPRSRKLHPWKSSEDLHLRGPADTTPVTRIPESDRAKARTKEQLTADNASEDQMANGSQIMNPTSKETVETEVLADLLLYKAKLLSTGRSSTVYEGRFESNIPVAIKKIYMAQTNADDLSEQLKILREVENARKMPQHNHPNIVRFIKSEVKAEFLYIAFELCQGTLQDYVKVELNWSEILPWKCVQRQMTCGLQFLHDTVKLAHRDLKPSNVLLVKSQTTSKVVLADFGHAKVLENFQCSMSGQPGSLGWIAKEVDEYRHTGRPFHQNSDIFPLGCLFYYVATDGKHPFGSTPIQQQAGISKNEKPNMDGLPNHLQCLKELISGMIVHIPEERPATGMIMEHPALFDDAVIIKFLHKASNLVNNYPQARQNILEDPSVIPGNNWVHLLPINTQTYLSNFTLPRHPQPMFQGKEASVRHLLRAIRNCSEHFKDLDATMRAEMGSHRPRPVLADTLPLAANTCLRQDEG